MSRKLKTVLEVTRHVSYSFGHVGYNKSKYKIIRSDLKQYFKEFGIPIQVFSRIIEPGEWTRLGGIWWPSRTWHVSFPIKYDSLATLVMLAIDE